MLFIAVILGQNITQTQIKYTDGPTHSIFSFKSFI